MGKKLRLALLISGGGTTAEAVIKACQSGKLNLDPAIVISSDPTALGLDKAKALGIKTYIVSKNIQLGDELLHIFRNEYIDIISQNGWLLLTPKIVVEKYQGRIINQHPGPLDPGNLMDFGGKGMFGARVTAARLAYIWATGTELWTEATAHFVTEEFDKGKLISVERMTIPFSKEKIPLATLQSDLRIQKKLIAETKRVQAKLLPIEHINFTTALQKFAEGEHVKGYTRSEPLIPSKNTQLLSEIKKLTITLFPNG